MVTRTTQIPKHASLLRITSHAKLCLGYAWKTCAKNKSIYVITLSTGALIYARVSCSVQMSLSCSQSKFMLLNQHIWSIFNLEQTTMQSRLIICPMVVSKLCTKEHSTRTARKKNTSIISLKPDNFVSCLSD